MSRLRPLRSGTLVAVAASLVVGGCQCLVPVCELGTCSADDAGADAGGDAGVTDAGAVDGGAPDAGTPDSGTPDAGAPDAGPPDSGVVSDCFMPPQGIVSWWPGDDNPDDIVGSNTGTLVSAGYGPGVVNDAFLFDGGGYLDAPTSGLPTGTADRTLELWARVDAEVTVEDFLAGYGTFGNDNATYQLGVRLSQVYFSQWGQAIFGPNIALGTWTHVAATTANGVTTLYLNGTAVGTGSLPLATPSGSDFVAGRIPGINGNSRQLVGSVDEITVYDRALSIDEIQAIVDAGVAGKCRP